MSEIEKEVVIPVVTGLTQGRKIDGRVIYDVKAKRELIALLQKWLTRERTGVRPTRRNKAKPRGAMVPIVVKPAVALRPIATSAGLEIELSRGKVRINHVDAQMLGLVFELLGAH
jgi:hypothetical protein